MTFQTYSHMALGGNLNPDKPVMKVRREKLRTGHKRHVTVKVEKIDDAANELRNIEAELFVSKGQSRNAY